MTSKEYFEILTEELAENGFHISSKNFGDGYFVFEMGEDSVCHFIVKEIPHWKFGIWFTYSKDEESKNQIIGAEVFTRHTDDLDKFKPSRSFYTTKEIFEVDLNPNDEYVYSNTIEYTVGLCKLIKHYPILTYLTSYYCGWDCIDNHMFGTYIRIRFSEKKYAIKRWYNNVFKFNMTYIKIWFMRKYLLRFSDITSIDIIDNCSDDLIVSPRYDMVIKMNSEQCDDKIPGYVYYQISGKRRCMSNAYIYFIIGDEKRGSQYVTYREDYFLAYGWRAKLFGRNKYIDKIPRETN